MNVLKRSNSFYPAFPDLWDNFFGADLKGWDNSNFSSTNTSLPAVNIKETGESYEIEVAAPGMNKKDFNVILEKNILSISSEKKEENTANEKNFSRREFSYQSFKRSFSLPENQVEGEKITAKYNDGILCITLPKKEEVKPKPPREIKIV